MKRLTIAAFVAAQLLTVQPAGAASLGDDTAIAGQRQGTFAGARLRLSLGGSRSHRARAELGIAPVTQGRLADGSTRTRFGEGVQISLTEGEKPGLRLGGVDFAERLAAAEEGQKRKSSTGKKILKGAAIAGLVGVAVVGGLFLLFAVSCADNRCSE